MSVLGTVRGARPCWMALLMVVLMLMIPKHVTSSALHVNTANEFCNKTEELLECIFTNPDQEVEMNSVVAGIRDVRLQAAATFRGHPPCGAHLEILSSKNVTLVGANATAGSLIDTSLRSSSSIRVKREANRNGEAVSQPSNATSPVDKESSSTSVLRDVITSISDGTESLSTVAKARTDNCVGNVSIYQSEVHWIKGDFDHMSLKSNEVRDIDGRFIKLMINRSRLSNVSIVGNHVSIERTVIEELRQLDVSGRLQIHKVNIRHLSNLGIILRQSTNMEGTDSSSNEDFPHELSNVLIGVMKIGKLKVIGSQLTMSDIVIEEAGTGVIVVRSGGKLTINNLMIKKGERSCLILNGEASIILNNFTLVDKHIRQFDMSNKNTGKLVYPLHAHWPINTKVIKTLLTRIGNSDEDSDDISAIEGIKWYWISLAVMAGVGLISGIIIGTALMWKKPKKKPEGLTSTLTLSELLARERQEEEARGNTISGPQRPDYIRQDSGLTSSSFASYAVCQDSRLSSQSQDRHLSSQSQDRHLSFQSQDRHLSSQSQDRRLSSYKHPEDLDHILLDTSEPNLFIHIPPISCSREEVIYEEVEALPMPKDENNFIIVK